MSDYRDEILQKIRELTDQGDLAGAFSIVSEELRMPYVETGFREALEERYRQLDERLKEAQPAKEFHPGRAKLREYLLGDAEQQFAAVGCLAGRNLRNEQELIQEYLSRPDRDPLAAGALIEEMIDQQLLTEFHTDQGPLEYSFIPGYLLPLSEDEGFLTSREYFRDWFGSNEPSAVELCGQALIEEAYRRLPDQWEAEDSLDVALTIARYVFRAWGREADFAAWLREQGYQDRRFVSLAIENDSNKGIII